MRVRIQAGDKPMTVTFEIQGDERELAAGDYQSVLIEESSVAEQACAIFCNVLDLDADGRPTNGNEAEVTAAQYIRKYCDTNFEVDPPFEYWELDRP
ncbi:hypothetical protein ACFXO9_02380 [Nocardia tengchongensis]|uniref:DUF7677 family protein n=1 Tax=Nocardia tengchongensis TaxID=2055889 RepID=UPI0036B493C0